jgi:hypothetical protein
MSSLSLSNLFTTHTQILTFRPSPTDANTTLIDRAGPNNTITPLFSLTSYKSKSTSLSRIGAGTAPLPSPILIGTSKYSSLTSSSTLTLPNAPPIKLTSSSAGDGYKFTCAAGRFKWKAKFSGTLELQDEGKHTLARYMASAGSKGGPGAAKFEVLVPVDEYLLDVVVFSGLSAAKMLEKDKKALEMVAEVISGVAS